MLYEVYVEKLEKSIYQKRRNSPLKALKEGKEKFSALDVKEQAKVLLNIHQVFGRESFAVDLTAVGGAKNAAVPKIDSKLSSWAKVYKDVRIIDTSVSGLWEKKSVNLLELL